MHETESILFLLVVIVAAKVAAELCERLKQPAVLGEILAGTLLALVPAFAGTAGHPGIADNEAIKFLAEIGVIILLFEVGLESELSQLMKVGKQAVTVAVIGVGLPLIGGWGLFHAMGYTTPESLFMGGILTATSVGITARVFRDLKVLRTRSAQVVIGAAVVDDVLGLLTLAVLVSVFGNAGGTGTHPGVQIAEAVIFLFGAVFIGLRIAPWMMGVVRKMRATGTLTVAAVGFCLLVAFLGASIGLATIVGAFAAGLVLASTDERIPITDRVRPAAELFVPVFFVLIGMRVDLSLFNPFNPANHATLLLALALFVVAVPTKLVAGWGAKGTGIDRLLVGIGMVPRGEVGLIFATIGLGAGLLQENVYGAAVIALLGTTLVVPPWLSRRLKTHPQANPPAPAH